ncbi:hypothetical protein M9458_019805, partial [Cirrhinus mrigala]
GGFRHGRTGQPPGAAFFHDTWGAAHEKIICAAKRFSIVYDTRAAPAAEGAAQKLSERRREERRGDEGGAEYSSPLPNEADKEV